MITTPGTPAPSSAPAAPASPAQATAAPTPATNPAAPASAPAAVASPQAPQQTTEPGQVTSPTSAVTPVVGAAPTVDPRAEIDQLAISHGYEPYMLAAYTDVASAKAAIRDAALQAVQYSRGSGQAVNPLSYQPQNPYQAAGMNQQPVLQQPPQAPATPTARKPLDLKAFGLEEDEPAAKAIRELEKELAAPNTTVTELQKRLDSIERANRETVQANALAEANSFIDGLKSTKYGVGRTRTQGQQFALNRLIDLADDIAIGHYNATINPVTGQGQVLPISVRLARAVAAEESATVAPPLPAPATPPADPLRQTAAPTTPGPQQPWNPNAKWSQNPEIRQKAGIR